MENRTLCRVCGKELDDTNLKLGSSIIHCNRFNVVGNRKNIEIEIQNKNEELKKIFTSLNKK